MNHEVASATLLRPDAIDSVEPSVPFDPPHESNNPVRHRRRALLRRLASEGAAVYVVSLVIYIVVGVLLDFKYTTFAGDAVSRMANGFYVLYSRDPHLAAIGFVWEPLTSLTDMVFLLGNHIWPALSHNDMAGSLTSATAMAGAAYQLASALARVGAQPHSPTLANRVLRSEPHDPALWGERNERRALSLHTHRSHSVFSSLDPFRRLAVIGICRYRTGALLPDEKRSNSCNFDRGLGCRSSELLAS